MKKEKECEQKRGVTRRHLSHHPRGGRFRPEPASGVGLNHSVGAHQVFGLKCQSLPLRVGSSDLLDPKEQTVTFSRAHHGNWAGSSRTWISLSHENAAGSGSSLWNQRKCDPSLQEQNSPVNVAAGARMFPVFDVAETAFTAFLVELLIRFVQ